MIVSIMQPYLLPYVGYFQLIAASDVFVLYDDVQYMKGGWVNRNRILLRDAVAWLTVPVASAPLSSTIAERRYKLDGPTVDGLCRRLDDAYAGEPCFGEVARPVRELLTFADANVARFNANLLRRVAAMLGIDCRFVVSSELDKPAGLRGEARVIDLVRRLGATRYVNAIGGTALYDRDRFAAAGLELAFLRTSAPPTPLGGGPQHLSILHLLATGGVAGCRDLLPRYELLEA